MMEPHDWRALLTKARVARINVLLDDPSFPVNRTADLDEDLEVAGLLLDVLQDTSAENGIDSLDVWAALARFLIHRLTTLVGNPPNIPGLERVTAFARIEDLHETVAGWVKEFDRRFENERENREARIAEVARQLEDVQRKITPQADLEERLTERVQHLASLHNKAIERIVTLECDHANPRMLSDTILKVGDLEKRIDGLSQSTPTKAWYHDLERGIEASARRIEALEQRAGSHMVRDSDLDKAWARVTDVGTDLDAAIKKIDAAIERLDALEEVPTQSVAPMALDRLEAMIVELGATTPTPIEFSDLLERLAESERRYTQLSELVMSQDRVIPQLHERLETAERQIATLGPLTSSDIVDIGALHKRLSRLEHDHPIEGTPQQEANINAGRDPDDDGPDLDWDGEGPIPDDCPACGHNPSDEDHDCVTQPQRPAYDDGQVCLEREKPQPTASYDAARDAEQDGADDPPPIEPPNEEVRDLDVSTDAECVHDDE